MFRALTALLRNEQTSLMKSRFYTSLPEDMAAAAQKARFPSRRTPPPADASLSSSAAASGAAAGQNIDSVKEGAKIASSWMFPWERRQMEGGKLRTWEKAYWGVFVVAISVFLFNKAKDWNAPEIDAESAEEIRRARDARRAQVARLVLAGGSIVEESDDPFEGMDPEEVQQCVERATGATSADPFEGMTPEEINDFLAAQQSNPMRAIVAIENTLEEL